MYEYIQLAKGSLPHATAYNYIKQFKIPDISSADIS